MLSIRYPIVQSGMGRVAGPELVAEVSNAGGLGILAGLNSSPDALRRDIDRVRALTDAPFGVNLWLLPELQPPVDPSTLQSSDVRAVNAALNRARRAVSVPESDAAPPRRPDWLNDAMPCPCTSLPM